MPGFSRVSAALRRLLHRALDRFDLPVLSGLNRGRRWRVGSGVLACWLGSYETEEMAVFAALARPGATVWDLGAHAGYFTLLASRRVGASGHVLAVEPHPVNLAALRHHLALNGAGNVTVLERAVCDVDGSEVAFSTDDAGHGYGGKVVPGDLKAGGSFRVRTATLDALIAAGERRPDLVKMDVEAMEAAVLEGAVDLLASGRTVWMISMHLRDVAIRTIDLLRASGLDIYSIDGSPVPFATREKAVYPDILWMLLAVPAGHPVPRVGLWKN